MSGLKKTIIIISFFIVLLTIDTIGYLIIVPGINIVDALYMTFISITTVGYSEVFPLNTLGKIFTIWVIISGLGIFFYIIGTIAENMFEGNIRKILGRRKMKVIKKLKDHVIIAGFGIMGEQVCKQLDKKNKKFVIIENNRERFAVAEELEFNVLLGDATNEDILLNAGAKNAKTFVSLLASDVDNIYTVMTVKDINPSVFIITRAQDLANEKRLYKIGADRVVTPYELGSRRIVNTVIKPNLVEFIDLMTYTPQMSLSIEELTISENSPFAGKRIKNSGLREKHNIIIIAIKRDKKMFFNPPSEQKILADDILIIVGEKEKLLSL